MRYRLLVFYFFAIAFSLQGQEDTMPEKGKVSYITSQNVYVKFETTENIQIGDTLFANKKGQITPVLVVGNKSSISCVCTPISPGAIALSDEIFSRKVVKDNPPDETPLTQQDNNSSTNEEQPRYRKDNFAENPKNPSKEKEDIAPQKQLEKESPKPIFKQRIKGRISAASYMNLSDLRSNQRMRYTFVMRGDNLGNTRLSMDTYVSFRHTFNEWEEVQNNLSSALKIYSLALKYDFDQTTSVSVGRKINPMISSMGASDGIQFEKGFGNFLFGALVGSRPDYLDYNFNPALFQFGTYLSHRSSSKNKYLQSTIAFIEQRNNSKIDRRFIYLQHTSSLFKNLNLFCSAEMSLYENINEQPKNVFNLTNLYASLRYRATRKLNFSVSYDNRKNVQYYETYKSFIDKLIEQETRQGVRFRTNYRLFKNVTWGVNTGWRFQKSDRNLSKNLNSYLTFNRIPSLNIRATINANFLQTNYLNSRILGIRLSKDIVPGKIDGGVNFRVVDYDYLNYETATHQNIVGINLSMKIIKKLSLYVNYEGTFDSQNIVYSRFYTKIIQRF